MSFKYAIILFLLISSYSNGLAQNNETPNENNTHYSLEMEYPREAELNEIEGVITVTFDLDSTCSIVNVRQDIILGFGCEDVMFDSLCELETLLKKDFNSTCEPLIDNTLPAVFQLERDEITLE